MRRLRGSNVQAVLATVVPIVRGWSAFYRGVVSKQVFTSLDDHMWRLTYKWATCTHPNKPKSWVIARYYGRFHSTRTDRWIFGNRNSGAYLPKFVWTKIVWHYMVRGTASPDDPTLAQYWTDRRRRNKPPLDNATLRLLQAQHGRCPLCGDYLLRAEHEPASPREWEQWLTGTRKAISRHSLDIAVRGSDDIRLTHTSCRRQTIGAGRESAFLHT
jgi:RNA-directed DNA polymerase